MGRTYHLQSRQDLFDLYNEFYFECRTNIREVIFPHRHDYFELCLLMEGSLIYQVDDWSVLLKPGSITFTRPQDIHSRLAQSAIRQLTISFPANAFSDLCTYLGPGFDGHCLLHSPHSPYTYLSTGEVAQTYQKFEKILVTEDLNRQNTMLRILLLELLSSYFMDASPPINAPTDWLSKAMKQMEQKENLVQGLPAFLRLCGKSHEHLCRTMKRYYQMTPSRYINDLRLAYAENLLLHTDMDILSIAIEAGFNNLSYFYTEFEKRYRHPPLRYRKKFLPAADAATQAQPLPLP